jgi:hypothetical protein
MGESKDGRFDRRGKQTEASGKIYEGERRHGKKVNERWR